MGQAPRPVPSSLVGRSGTNLRTAASTSRTGVASDRGTRRGDAAAALAAWQKAAALYPNSARIQDEIGFLLAVLNRRDEALPPLRTRPRARPQIRPRAISSRCRALARQRSGPGHPAPAKRRRARLQILRLPLLPRPGAERDIAICGRAVPTLPPPRHSIRNPPKPGTNSGSRASGPATRVAAIDAYRRAVVLSPGNLDARNNLGFVLVNSGRAEEGLAQFEKILAADPANNMARVNAGFAHLQKADLDRPPPTSAKSCAATPIPAIAHYDLGVALKQKDDLEPAKVEIRSRPIARPATRRSDITRSGSSTGRAASSSGAAREMRAAIAINPSYGRGILHARHGAQAEWRA